MSVVLGVKTPSVWSSVQYLYSTSTVGDHSTCPNDRCYDRLVLRAHFVLAVVVGRTGEPSMATKMTVVSHQLCTDLGFVLTQHTARTVYLRLMSVN